MVTLDKLVQFAKSTGFIFQGSEIYGGLANTWDYGPLGSMLKQNVKNAWIKKFQKEQPLNVLFDSSILLNTRVWEASGHLKGFNDPLTECDNCHHRFRADNLINEQYSDVDSDGWSNEKLNKFLKDNEVKCPNCGKSKWMDIRSFNMMFQTFQGVILEKANQIYLRPETAQGIFINFKNIQRTTRKKLPFGVCQVGKAFRNEITPGNFIFRTREFEQMELEFFCKPGTEDYWFKYWREYMMNWLLNLGLSKNNLRYLDHLPEKLSHYSKATTDIEYLYPWGFDELWGIASRTNFDLSEHQKESNVDLTYLDPDTNERYIPYVVEPSVGVERLILAFLTEGYHEEQLENGDVRQVLKLHPTLSPYKVAVLPLIKKLHQEKAEEIYFDLMKHFDTTYDETQNIGKRYRRQDSIGTYLCVTIDHDTEELESVTVRNRDTMEQERVLIKDLVKYIDEKIKY